MAGAPAKGAGALNIGWGIADSTARPAAVVTVSRINWRRFKFGSFIGLTFEVVIAIINLTLPIISIYQAFP
jgi:hypothetical protein